MSETPHEDYAEKMACLPSLSGLEKSVMLLRVLGNESVKPILPFLDRHEVEQIAQGMANMKAVNKEEAAFILENFHKEVTGLIAPGAADSQAQSLLEQYEEVQIELSPEAGKRQQLKSIFALEKLEPDQLFRLLENEHAQVWAILLSQLPSDQSMAVVNLIDVNKRYDILQRLASLKCIDVDILSSLNQVLEKKLDDADDAAHYNGAKTTADILSLLPEADSSTIMEMIEKTDKALYLEITQYFLSFSGLISFDVLILQKIFSTLDPQVIAAAICQSSSDIIDKCCSAVTRRAVTLIEDEIKALRQAPAAVVQEAQQTIIATARRLEAENQITLGTPE